MAWCAAGVTEIEIIVVCGRRIATRSKNVAVREAVYPSAPQVAPTRKVMTKPSSVNVSIIRKKRSGEEMVPGPTTPSPASG